MTRGVIIALAVLAVGLFSTRYGDQWRVLDVPSRVVRLGLVGVLLYVMAGQVKADRLSIPIDAYTWGGVVALVVTDTGLLWLLARRYRRPRG